MKAIEKTIFSKKERLELLITSHANWCKSISSAIFRTCEKNPDADTSELEKKFFIAKSRFFKLKKIHATAQMENAKGLLLNVKI